MKNCEFYGLFDYTASDGDIYEYTSAEWSQYIKGITGNGISKNALNEFAPTANGLVITIASGEAYIEGRYAYNTTATQFSLTPTSTGQNRYDRIVLELDEENRVIGLNVITGTASTSTPTKPTLNANQLPICSVLVKNGSTTTITDERKFTYSATAIQSQLNNYLPTSGGTITGKLTVNSNIYSKGTFCTQANSFPSITFQSEAGKNLGKLYMNTSTGDYSNVNLQVYTDTTNYNTFTFASNGNFRAFGTCYGSQFVSQTNTNPQVMLQNASGAPLGMLYMNTTTGGYSSAYLRVYSSASAYSTFNFGNDGKLSCGSLALATALPISSGGTGSTTASGALTNLGIVYSSTQPTAEVGRIWLKPMA